VLRNAAGGKFSLLFYWISFLQNLFFSEEIVVHVNKEQEKDRDKFTDKSTGLEMEHAIEPQSLLEWFAEKYKEFGANLEFVTNRSQEGAQFVKGFGGIGGLLRYKVDFQVLTSIDEDEDEFFSDDDGGI
jgi:peptide chain release factor subunit 1